MEQQTRQIWKTALYLRLSQEDADTEAKGESTSISTQRIILRDYAERNELLIVGEYVDDGYSGTTFDRPAFQKMLIDIEAGKVNCVITKDLSRLGRNCSQVMTFIDEWFPLRHVRYISVSDQYDTMRMAEYAGISASLMASINELYARDTSSKIRTSLKAKMEQGQFISPFAPYGYRKDAEDKNKLVVDPVSAAIVRDIFQRAAEGETPGQIAKALNDANIPTPAQYRCANNPKLDIDDYSQRKEWVSSGIVKMLRNRVYLGELSQGKTSKLSFKSDKQIIRKQDEWITVQDTHEAIISEELFAQVRCRSVARRKTPNRSFHNIFSGIAFCADCGKVMSIAPARKKGAIYNLQCGAYKQYGARECSNHYTDYGLLCEAVLSELQGMLKLPAEEKAALIAKLEREEKAERARQYTRPEVQAIEQQTRRKEEVIRATKKLYEDNMTGRISATMYDSLFANYQKELQQLEDNLSFLKKQIHEVEQVSDKCRNFFELFTGIEEIDTLTKPCLLRFIDRIEVEQGIWQKDETGKKNKVQKIHIFWKFIGNTELKLLAS